MILPLILCNSVLWCAALCFGVWHCALVCGTVLWCVALCFGVWHCVLVCGIVFWCVALCFGVWHCVMCFLGPWPGRPVGFRLDCEVSSLQITGWFLVPVDHWLISFCLYPRICCCEI